jgi:plastocyanin
MVSGGIAQLCPRTCQNLVRIRVIREIRGRVIREIRGGYTGEMARWSRLAVCTVVLIGGCGSGPSGPSGNDAVVTIGPNGVAPAEVRIKAWNRVAFVNNDTRPHTIVSDPVDLHTQCPQVNQVGVVNPGERRTTGTLNLTGVCGFHDHANKSDASLMGRIVVE